MYKQKKIMTKTEEYFYNIFKYVETEFGYIVQPQVNLASIIEKETSHKYINELFRNIDFAIFDKDYSKLLLLIEINDNSHFLSSERIERDNKVNSILKDANIKLVKFYPKYSHIREKIIDRLLESLDLLI